MKKTLIFFSVALIQASIFGANGLTEVGLTLIESPSARSSALGQAFTAMPNDVSAIHYNPSALESLKRDQASFLYQKGILDDAYGQFSIGHPLDKGSIGATIGYYDSGDIDGFDGTTRRTITGQRDLVVGLVGANNIGKLDYGATLKYFSSEIGETASAQTITYDLGLGYFINSALRIGFATQNLGARVKYDVDTFNLPQYIRSGASYQSNYKNVSTILSIEAPYSLNTQEINPGLGLEASMGPLSMRMGYHSGKDIENITVGTGFAVGPTQLDYSFGVVSELDSRHRISLSYHFGRVVHKVGFVEYRDNQKSPVLVKKHENIARHVKEIESEYVATNFGGKDPKRRVYTVKEGETLKSIAENWYGYADYWDDILNANKHLGLDPENLQAGIKIILPKREY